MAIRNLSDKELLDKCLDTEIFIVTNESLSSEDLLDYKRFIVRMHKEIKKRNLTPKTGEVDATSD